MRPVPDFCYDEAMTESDPILFSPAVILIPFGLIKHGNIAMEKNIWDFPDG